MRAVYELELSKRLHCRRVRGCCPRAFPIPFVVRLASLLALSEKEYERNGNIANIDDFVLLPKTSNFQPAHRGLDFLRGRYVAEQLPEGERTLELSIEALRAKVEQVKSKKQSLPTLVGIIKDM